MITSLKRIIIALFIMLPMTVFAQATGNDALIYQTNQPFGWATCSNVSGKEYVVDGGMRRDRKSTRLNSSHMSESRMPSSA